MAAPFKDIYHLRHVAEAASKACAICYKPTSAVLVSSDGKADFFYVCEAHLKDSSFATPKVDPEVEAAKAKKALLEKEIESLKVEWANRKKKDKSKETGTKENDDIQKQETDHETEKNNEMSSLEQIISKPPRVFILNKDIYNIRLQNYRNAQRAKQTAAMLRKPTLFPKAPTHIPSGDSSSSPSPPLPPKDS